MQLQIEFDAAPPVHLVFQEMGLNKMVMGDWKLQKQKITMKPLAIAKSRI